MKLSEDQKKFIKMSVIYFTAYIILFPIMQWIMGKGLTWENFLNGVLIAAAVVVILLPIYLLGSHVPTKEDWADKEDE